MAKAKLASLRQWVFFFLLHLADEWKAGWEDHTGESIRQCLTRPTCQSTKPREDYNISHWFIISSKNTTPRPCFIFLSPHQSSNKGFCFFNVWGGSQAVSLGLWGAGQFRFEVICELRDLAAPPPPHLQAEEFLKGTFFLGNKRLLPDCVNPMKIMEPNLPQINWLLVVFVCWVSEVSPHWGNLQKIFYWFAL